VFWSFRIMVGVGVLMLFISWFTLWRFWRHGTDAVPRPLLVGFVAMTFSGWVATLAGWYTTEIGRQPWLVDGVLSTSAAVADVPAPMVLSTLLVYLTTYVALTFAYVSLLFYLARKAARGEEVQALTPTSGAAEVQLVPGE
jgi:cytochrome d ubiquinol oxidase subunit I